MPGERVSRALRLRAALGSFFEQARVPVLVLEPNGRFATANDAALKEYGYRLEELLELGIHDLMARPRPELAAELRRAYCNDPRPLERRAHRRKDGSTFWVAPVGGMQSVDGQSFIMSIQQDVTALVGAEDMASLAHARSEVLWEGAVERFGGALALFDADRRAVRANRTLLAWLKLTDGEIVGRRCDELFPRACAAQPCSHALAASERRRIAFDIESTLGRSLHVEVFPAPANETGVTTIHLAHDRSDEHAMRSHLVAADRLASLGRVAAGVAHEVNNPAAFVTLALPLAKDRIAQGRTSEAIALLDEAIAATGQITEVMRDLGGAARDRPRAVVDLAALARGAVRIASYEAESRAQIDTVFEDGVGVDVRATRVAQVLLNLVLNAAQAIPEGDAQHQRIEVRVRPSGDQALVEVADTGPGVPEAVAGRLFEPFFTTRSAFGGTGLGLWLSRSIVEEEGGTLTWRNRPEGGALFTVSLPLYRPAVAEERASAE